MRRCWRNIFQRKRREEPAEIDVDVRSRAVLASYLDARARLGKAVRNWVEKSEKKSCRMPRSSSQLGESCQESCT